MMSTAQPNKNTLAKLARGVTEIIQRDPARRGLALWAEEGMVLEGARSLLSGTSIAITTGFYIQRRGVIETDGPLGAMMLARALEALGKRVTLVVDDHAAGIFAKVAEEIPVISVPAGVSSGLTALGTLPIDHFVAIERPGRSANGRYYNMRGDDLSDHVAEIDELFLDPQRSYRTIAVGDGGNELGMAAVASRISQHLSRGARIACYTPADMPIYAGVSNWGGYGLCCLLQALSGEPVMPTPSEVIRLLQQLVAAGAVDGVRMTQTMTVDGLPNQYEWDTVQQLQQLLKEHRGKLS